MTKILLLCCLISLITLRCSHTAKNRGEEVPFFSQQFHNIKDKDLPTTEAYLKKVMTENSDKVSSFWAGYKLAQLWAQEKPLLACENFLFLSKQKDFPLKDLAQLKTFEFCKLSKEETQEIFSMDPEGLHKWLRPQIYDLRYRFAKEQGLSLELAESAIAKSKISVIQGEKVALTQEAIAQVNKLNDVERSKEYQERLLRLAPRFKKNPKPEEWLDVAYDYRREREFPKAILYYKKILKRSRASLQEKVKAWQGIQRSYKLQRDKERHIQSQFSLASMADINYRKNKNDAYAIKLHHDSQIALARALWTEGEVTKARNILELLVKWMKGKYPLDLAYWLIARMEEEKQHFEKAISYAEKSIAEAKPKSEYKLNSLWIVAWNQRKLKDYKNAVKNFQALIDETDNIYEQRKYKFWLANSYKLWGDTDTAHQLWKELGQEDSQGYYGLLSYRERGEAMPPLPPAKILNSLEELELNLSDDKKNQIHWLIAVDELEFAQTYLDQVGIQTTKVEELKRIYAMYGRAGHYSGIFRSLGSMEPEKRQELLDTEPGYLFPRPDYPLVQEASARFGVSSSLIYSIIRQESSFIPHARSFADAYGLMQLIPKQADRLAKKHAIPYKTAEDLYYPPVNIPLGTAFLKELWERHHGQFIVTAASYNASERAVFGWIRTRYRGDSVSFIEDIPYEETKAYVKLVLRNFIFYQRLESRTEEYLFPDWVFEGLDRFK